MLDLYLRTYDLIWSLMVQIACRHLNNIIYRGVRIPRLCLINGSEVH